MTTITNLHHLPETVYRAICNDSYSKGAADFSCSELVQPPRITILKQRHDSEIIVDATEQLWMFLGKLGHMIAEQAGADNALIEERLFAKVAGRKISGASDIGQWVLEDGVITDYKLMSVYAGMSMDRVPDWTAQQNIYAWLFAEHGFPIKALRICAIYRDWRPGEAKQRPKEYPPRAQIINLDLWPQWKTGDYILDRLTALMAAEKLPDEELPKCTARNMWEKPATWAVAKPGAKRALRVFDNRHAADEFCKPPAEIAYRPGRRPRCEEYCPVNRWCSQYQEYAKRNDEPTSEEQNEFCLLS